MAKQWRWDKNHADGFDKRQNMPRLHSTLFPKYVNESKDRQKKISILMIFIIFSTTYRDTDSITQFEQFNFRLQRKYINVFTNTLFSSGIADQLDKATGIFEACRHETE